jgi:hypothetical protein
LSRQRHGFLIIEIAHAKDMSVHILGTERLGIDDSEFPNTSRS